MRSWTFRMAVLVTAIFVGVLFFWFQIREFPLSYNLQLDLKPGEEKTIEFPESSEWIYLKGKASPPDSVKAYPFPSSYLEGSANEIAIDESGFFRANGKFEKLTLKAFAERSLVQFKAWTAAERRQVKLGRTILLSLLLVCSPAVFFLLTLALNRWTRPREGNTRRKPSQRWIGPIVLLSLIGVEIYFSWMQRRPPASPTTEQFEHMLQRFALYRVVMFGTLLGLLAMVSWEGRPIAGTMRIHFSWKDYFLGLLTVPLVMGIQSLMQSLFGAAEVESENLQVFFPLRHLLGPFSLCVFFGAITEELVYRGYLMTRIGEWGNKPLIGALIVNVLFALTHIEQGIVSVGSIFLVGLLWSLMAWRRQNLLPGIVSHGVWNLALTVLVFHSPSRVF